MPILFAVSKTMEYCGSLGDHRILCVPSAISYGIEHLTVFQKADVFELLELE